MANIPSDSIQIRTGHVFPDMERIPYQKKQLAEYNLKMAKVIYGEYSNNKGDIHYTEVDEYVDTLRKIAQGRQSAEQYKDFFTGGEIPSLTLLNSLDSSLRSNAEASRKGWFTGFWKAVSVIPNMKTRCKGEFLKSDVDIKTFCNDVDANTEEIFRMNKEWVKRNPKLKRVTDMLRSMVNLPAQDQITIDSYEALQDIKDEGGFKERYMTAADKLIAHTEYVSDWKLHLKEELFDDLFDLGCAYAIQDYDYTDCKVIWKYLDVKDVVKQFGEKKDGKDSQYTGWFEYPSLNRIRQIQDRVVDGVTGKVGLTNDDFMQIAKNYKNYKDNAKSKYYTVDQIDEEEIDIKVCVLKVRWIDVEKNKKSKYTNNGKTSDVPYKPSHDKNKAYEVIEERELKRYECKWLVGTPYVWDFGTAKNQTFVNGNPTLGMAFFKMKEESYIERLVPIAHLFAISFLNFTNFMAKSQKSFIALDRTKLMLLGDGDKKMDPTAAIKLLRQELVYIYDGDETTQGGDNVPIKYVKGVEMEHLMSELKIMEQLLQIAEYITGLSPMSIGVTPDSNTPVRTALASLNSTNVALSYVMNAVAVIKTSLAEQTIPAAQNLLDIDERAIKYYTRIIGPDDVDAIKQNSESLSHLGIKLFPAPPDDMKERIVQNMQAAVQIGLLDPVTATKLEYQLYHGSNFMDTLHKLEYRIEKEKKRQTEEKQALIDRQTEGNKQAARVQVEGNAQIMRDKMAADAAREREKGYTQTVVDDNKFSNDMISKTIDELQEKGQTAEQILAEIKLAVEQQKEALRSA